MTPCLYTDSTQGVEFKNFSIIQDINILDSNNRLTTSENDGRASEYDAGFLCHSTFARFDNLTIFGLYPKGGLVITATDAENNRIDNEYQAIRDCLISSGLAIIAGSEGSTGSLTGLTCIGSGLYGADHHTRNNGLYDVPTLFIDGDLRSQSGDDTSDIRGASFIGCHFRTYANDAIVLRHCNDTSFISCTAEFPTLKNVNGADKAGGFVGESYTGNVRSVGFASTGNLRVLEFIKTIKGKFQFIGSGGFGGAYFGEGGKTTIISGDSSTGDSIIQLTNDVGSSNNGWTIRRDDSDNDALDYRYNGVSLLNLSSTGKMAIKEVAFKRIYPEFNSTPQNVAYPIAKDEKTGFYRAAANSVGLAINGVAQYVWTGGGNLLPYTDNANSLGSNTKRWLSVHVATPSETSNDYSVANTEYRACVEALNGNR